MADTTSKEIKSMEDFDAFKADMELAKYQARIENGELTPEELESRNAILDFLGFDKD